MAVVTGDRYLESLVRFVDRYAGPLLDGSLTLRLNPAGLHYVQSRLEALRELESLLAAAPVDYLRAYVSDLGDHRAIEQLRRFLGLLGSLKVVSVLPPPARDPTPVSLVHFGKLRVLELRGCDLSTSVAKGLIELSGTLEKLVCHNSTDALRHVFASRIVDVKESPVWTRLSSVSCTRNGLVLMDESLQLLPVVETLDLSRNRIEKIDNLRKCTRLKHLDLGFNRLRTIASFPEVSSSIMKLVLRNNAITKLHGIESLKSLQGLDLSYNIISSFTELEILTCLPNLESLWLEGNPICCSRWYRSHVFSFFMHPDKLKLDEKGISTSEYWNRRVILASSKKQPAGYGFYFPAKDRVEGDNDANSKKRKNFRLACIEDQDYQRHLCSDSVNEDSSSLNSDTVNLDENDASNRESEIISLMNRVEFMKKEGPVSWLREFKEWMDNPSMCQDGRQTYETFETTSAGEKNMTERKGQKYQGESSVYVDRVSNNTILDEDMPFGSYIGDDSVYLRANDKSAMKPAGANDAGVLAADFGTIGMKPEGDYLKVKFRKDDHSPVEIKVSSFDSSSTVQKGGLSENTISSATFAAIDEIMISRSPSMTSRSPPQYREDILHRRLNLEEEFLQIAESHSLTPSASDTSSSECDSFGDDSPPADSDSARDGISDDSDHSFYEAGHLGLHIGRTRGRNGLCPLGSSEGVDVSKERSFANANGASLITHNLNNTCENDVGNMKIENTHKTMKRRHKKNIKKIVSLEETFGYTDMEEDPWNANGSIQVNSSDVEAEVKVNPHANVTDGSYLEPSTSYSKKFSLVSSLGNGDFHTSIDDHQSSISSNPDKTLRSFFDVDIADSTASETCEELVICACLIQLGSILQEKEVAVLRSSKDLFYAVLFEASPDGEGRISDVIGHYNVNDIGEVIIGLGLQALRLHMVGGSTYLLLTRSIEKSKALLRLLRLFDSDSYQNSCLLRSWEQVQVGLLEKQLCGQLQMNILFYSMMLFWQNDDVGESWVGRSLFVIERYMLVCLENLVQFGASTEDVESTSPYYTIDSSSPIESILELVLDLDDQCVIMLMDPNVSGNICSSDETVKENLRNEKLKQAHATHSWKLKWYSVDDLLKFVALIKAVHSGLRTSLFPAERKVS